ncbi:beta-3 adrenergic receptor isoform X2 [Episyrphus balteatus]|uniref:beta-3 adrenergic receptor isoform X2 n=1 Tax=Episyrphus balteatus TaxID=286459 RepID=UPI0024867C36|nr:beta-3 adrenergic receptor isoform X2 [Episyrphus balteatus]
MKKYLLPIFFVIICGLIKRCSMIPIDSDESLDEVWSIPQYDGTIRQMTEQQAFRQAMLTEPEHLGSTNSDKVRFYLYTQANPTEPLELDMDNLETLYRSTFNFENPARLAMDLKTGTLLVPPTVKNSSCSHPRYTGHSFIIHIGIAETIEALLILILTLGVIGANALVIFVINNRRYSPYIHMQPRYLLTSLALNDLTIGLLITPFGLLPALFHCWPYGEIFCQIQGCVAIVSLTWIISLTVFGFLVLPKGYYFNNTGLMACEPFYSKPSYRILATCALYFPTTMVLMYCYGSSFHMSRFRLNDPTLPTTMAHHPHHPLTASTTLPNTPVMNLSMAMGMGLGGPSNTITKKIVPIQEKQLNNGSTSRSMAAMSLGFIVMVTPWTIQEIVTACTGSKLPPFLDFIVTWTALSNSFWNPFLYWLLNSQFRRLSRHLLPNRWCPAEDTPDHKSPCCHMNSECDITTLPMPPEPPTSRPPHSGASGGGGGRITPHLHTYSLRSHHHHYAPQHAGMQRPDIEGLSEKYWGEILERTVSSGSLHAMQKSFSSPHQPHHVTTSFSKNSDLSLTIRENGEDGNGGGGSSASILDKFSSSEPKLCEHIYHHDASCAKNKGTAMVAATVSTITNGSGSCQNTHHPAGRSIPDI